MAKKSVKVPQKFFETKDEFQTFVENEKEWMYTRIVEAIEQAFRNGQIEAHIFEARIEETMSVIAMNSEMEEWEKSLSLAMAWYEKQEKYESCAKILKLINEIRTVFE
jgi:hypothetical protein